MNSANLFTFIFILTVASGYVNSVKTGHKIQDSHPMLASLFNVANGIRKLQAQSADQDRVTHPRHPGNIKGLVKSPAHPANKAEQIDVGKFTKGGDLVTGPSTGSVHHLNAGNMDFLNPEIGMLLDPTVPRTPVANPQLGNVAIGGFVKPEIPKVSDIAADMMCALCRQRGDAKCIAIHCWNDGTSSVIAGTEQPPLQLQPSPVLGDKFDFRKQIDRHDLLQLTNIDTAPAQNVMDASDLNQPSLSPENIQRERTAPIWLMSDRLLGAPQSTVQDVHGGIDLVPVAVIQHLNPIDMTRNAVVANGPPSLNIRATEVNLNGQMENTGKVSNFGNIARPGSSVDQHTGTTSHLNGQHIDNFNNQPLDIPTDILMRLLGPEGPSFSQNLDTTLNPEGPINLRGSTISNFENNVNNGQPLIPVANDVFANNKNDIGLGFPLGFVEENTIIPQNNADTFTTIPHIPTASDIFPDARNEKNPTNKHTLVVKESGNTNKIAVLIGSGPVPDNGVSLFETRGQNANMEQTNVQPVDMHSLPHQAHENSHQSINHQHSLDNSNQNPNHQHSLDNSHQNPNHQHSLDNSNQNPNHQHSLDSSHQNPNHQHSLDNSHHNPNHQHSPLVNANKVQMNTAQQSVQAIDNLMNSMASQGLSPTTPIPTMNPVRKSELQNWSKRLLNGMHF